MWLSIFSGIGSFFSKQWELLTVIGAGFLVLVLVKDYIEDNAMTKRERDRLIDAFKRAQEAREAKAQHEAHINSLSRDNVINLMYENGEFRASEN